MKTEHTPTVWGLTRDSSGVRLVDGDHKTVCEFNNPDFTDRENYFYAEYVERACNSYDALVEALNLCRRKGSHEVNAIATKALTNAGFLEAK